MRDKQHDWDLNGCLWNECTYFIFYNSGVPKHFRVAAPFSTKFFPWRPTPKVKVHRYMKTYTVFGLFKYSCIRIDENILRINTLFFYENQKFRPQGDPL